MRARQSVSNSTVHDRNSLLQLGITGIPLALPHPCNLLRQREAKRLKSPKLHVRALEHVRRMRGGSQAHLMKCSDGFYYVVKFQHNPQHSRTLANDLLGTALALRMGLPAAPFAIVEVGEDLIQLTKALFIEERKSHVPCCAGLHFGSRFVGSPTDMADFNSLPDERLAEVENLRDFLGMFVFDKWTCNTDGRQTVFNPRRGRFHYRVTMIDQGYCFNAEKWNFPDSPLRGIYWRRRVYESVKDLGSFEPWIACLEQGMTHDSIEMAADQIPSEWYEADHVALHHLVEWLDRRRGEVRRLIEETMNYPLSVFPQAAMPYLEKH